jgi:Ulp1 family protease
MHKHGVDLFKPNYVLVPIHESGHWSLAIICNPGNMCVEKEAEARAALARCKAAKNTQAAIDELTTSTASTSILHLDSIEDGGHNSREICTRLRTLMRCVPVCARHYRRAQLDPALWTLTQIA